MGLRSFSSGCFSNVDVRIFSLLSFLVPLVVRVLPEVFMGGYIVGFDTISYYVPVTLRWVNDGVGFFEFLAYAPLFYVLLMGLTLGGVPVVFSLKVLPPVLFGFLGLVVFVYARKVLAWSGEKSLFVSCLATLYFVALRISWDMLRSELGLIFLFVFLIVLHLNWEGDWWKCYVLLLPAMVLVVLSHQLVAVVMFVVVSVWLVRKLFIREYGAAGNLVLCSLPAVLLFGLMVYANFVFSPDFSVISSFSGGDSSGWFSLFGFSSYFEMVASMSGFLVYCYLPVLVFMLIGVRFFGNLELKAWFSWCLIAAFSPIISPSAYRWVLLLVFPAAFFVVEGLRRLDSGLWRKVFAGFFVLLSFSFVCLPVEAAFPYFRVFPYYVPSSMLQNSVPLGDCGDVVVAFSWVRDNVGSDGVLLVHDAFHGWALLFLDGSRVVRYRYEDPEIAAEQMVGDGFGGLYVVWWVSGEGWHGQASLSSCFVEVFRSNRIAVYEYNVV